jgi:PKD repeat protein
MASYKDFLLTYNPASLWALDETSGSVAYDATAVQNGTFNGTPTFSQTPYFAGDSGKCIRFTKTSNQWITVPDNAAHRGATNMILEAWFKPATISGAQVIICKWGPAFHPDDFYQIYLWNNQLRVEFASGTGNTSRLYSIGAVANQWYHIVATKRGAQYRHYLNGTLLESFSGFSGPVNNAAGQVLFIGEGTGSNDHFNGWLDNVAIYTGANVPATDGALDTWVSEHYNWVGTEFTVDFSYDQSTGDPPLPVQFTDLSDGLPVPSSWSWVFGDSGVSNQKNPLHTYTRAGVYTVSLTASNGVESGTETKSDIINVNMVADFHATPSENTFPYTPVQFHDDTIGEPTSWSWSFGDGGTSTEQNPTHTYSASGYYTVTLTASNSEKSDAITKYNYVHVNLVGIAQKVNYIHVVGTLKTWDIAPPENRIDMRYAKARGVARYNTFENGARVTIPYTATGVLYSGFKRKNGPTLIYD